MNYLMNTWYSLGKVTNMSVHTKYPVALLKSSQNSHGLLKAEGRTDFRTICNLHGTCIPSQSFKFTTYPFTLIEHLPLEASAFGK